jgi:hypothetical protein
MSKRVDDQMASVISMILQERINTTIIDIVHDRPSNTFKIMNDQGHVFKVTVSLEPGT